MRDWHSSVAATAKWPALQQDGDGCGDDDEDDEDDEDDADVEEDPYQKTYTTSLSQGAPAGSERIYPKSMLGVKVGVQIAIGTGLSREVHIVRRLGSIRLEQPTRYPHEWSLSWQVRAFHAIMHRTVMMVMMYTLHPAVIVMSAAVSLPPLAKTGRRTGSLSFLNGPHHASSLTISMVSS